MVFHRVRLLSFADMGEERRESKAVDEGMEESLLGTPCALLGFLWPTA